MGSLKNGMLTVGFERFGYMAIQFFSGIVLARLLMPSDFGVMGMVAIFISISSLLVDSGMGGSLIYRKDVNEKDYSTIFWYNLAVSFLLYILLFFVSDSIAELYDTPIISTIIKIVGLVIIFNSLALIQSTILLKQLKFRRLAYITLVTYLLSTSIGIYLAWIGKGVWALVSQQILQSIFQTTFLLVTVKYKPHFLFSRTTFKKHLGFGSSLLFSSLLKIIYENLYVAIIGKKFQIDTVGYFNQAKRLQDIPYQFTNSVFDKAIFPVLSKVEDTKEYTLTATRLTRMLIMVIIPLLFLISLISKECILILFGSKWNESIGILTIISLGSIGLILENVSRNIIKARGATTLIFKLELIKKLIAIGVVIFSLRYGLNGILAAFVINGFMGYAFNVMGVSKICSYSQKGQYTDLMYFILPALIPYLCFFFLFKMYSFDNLYVDCFLKVTFFTFFYLAILKIMRCRELEILQKQVSGWLHFTK